MSAFAQTSEALPTVQRGSLSKRLNLNATRAALEIDIATLGAESVSVDAELALPDSGSAAIANPTKVVVKARSGSEAPRPFSSAKEINVAAGAGVVIISADDLRGRMILDIAVEGDPQPGHYVDVRVTANRAVQYIAATPSSVRPAEPAHSSPPPIPFP